MNDITEEEKNIISKIEEYILSTQKDFDLELLRKSVYFMLKTNKNRKRLSGENSSIHPISVAEIIAFEMNLDPVSIIAAYLHDSVENEGSLNIEDIETEFGSEVFNIVEGVLNLTNTKYKSKNEQRAASFRKMIQISTLKDVRVIFVKLADRLHNMRTLKFMSVEKQLHKAKETKELYAPIAHKLGLYNIKSELEDLSFKHLDNENYLKNL